MWQVTRKLHGKKEVLFKGSFGQAKQFMSRMRDSQKGGCKATRGGGKQPVSYTLEKIE